MQESHIDSWPQRLIRGPGMGGRIRHDGDCMWGAPSFCPNFSKPFKISSFRPEDWITGPTKNADPTTTDPQPHSLPFDLNSMAMHLCRGSHFYRDTFAKVCPLFVGSRVYATNVYHDAPPIRIKILLCRRIRVRVIGSLPKTLLASRTWLATPLAKGFSVVVDCSTEVGVAQTVFLVNRVLSPAKKGPFWRKQRKWQICILPTENKGLDRPPKTTKMTKITQEKAWFRKGRVCSSLKKGAVLLRYGSWKTILTVPVSGSGWVPGPSCKDGKHNQRALCV